MQDTTPTTTESGTETQNQTQFVTFANVMILMAVWFVLTLISTYALINSPRDFLGLRKQTAAKVVSLDFDRLLESGINQAVSANTTGSMDYKLQADAFQGRIARSIQDFTDRGYIIINQRALINKPKIDDITDTLIAQAAQPMHGESGK